MAHLNRAAIPGGAFAGEPEDLLAGGKLPGADIHKVHSDLAAAHHQRTGDIVAAVADIRQLKPLQGAKMLLDGQEVRKNLGWMPFVGKPIPDGDTAVAGKILDHTLGIAPEHDAVKHPAQDAGRILHRLLLAKVKVMGIQILRVATLVMDAADGGAVGPRRTLLEDEGYVLAIEQGVLQIRAALLTGLELLGKLNKTDNLLVRQIKQTQDALAMKTQLFQIHKTSLASNQCGKTPPLCQKK